MSYELGCAYNIKQFIDAHLQERLTARDIAEAVGYSPYHAARIFKEAFGLSPFEYVRQERLRASAYALRHDHVKVLDVALDFVFDSHAGFTRAFSKAFGITPKKYAGRAQGQGWRIPYHYTTRENRTLEGVNMETSHVIFTQIIERPARKLILKRSRQADDYFDFCTEIGCDDADAVWDLLTEIKEALYEPVGLWLPENMRLQGSGIYAQGVEVPLDDSAALPSGFDVIELPPCKMLVFQGEPYPDENFEQVISTCMAQIERFDPKIYGYRYAPQLAPRMQLRPEGWRGYIEMWPVTDKEENPL